MLSRRLPLLFLGLKGGTAINFFVRNLPRLSIDIDLTYIKTKPREEAINEIELGLEIMAKMIVKRNKRYQITEQKTRDKLIKMINKELTNSEREFILSVKKGKPECSLMPFANLDKLPALTWKVKNILNMDKRKHRDMLGKLESVLAIDG